MSSHRSIARLTTNALPTWAQGLTPGTLYAFGGNVQDVNASLAYPGGSFITNMDGGTDGTPWAQHRGWGHGLWAGDAGMHGTFVYGRTGESTLENQRTALPLSQNSPVWAWWQQPVACLSEAEAAAADADYYYNPTDYAAIPLTNRVNSASWASWSGSFPVALESPIQSGWIVRRKVKRNDFGNATVPRYRYGVHAWIPPEWTGTGAGAMVYNPQTLGGPGQSGTGLIGGGITAAQWFDAGSLYGTGRVKQWLLFENTQTKLRSFAPVPIPDYGPNGVAPSGFVCKDDSTRRLYYITNSSLGWGYWYADFSNGLAGMTTGAFTLLTAIGSADFAPTDSAHAAFTNAHPSGRRIAYWRQFGDLTSHLMVFDLDNGTFKKLTGLDAQGLTWARTSGGLRVGMEYLPETNEVLMFEHSTVGSVYEIWLHRFVVPSDPMDQNSYSFSKSKLTPNAGVTVDQPDYFFGDKCKRILTLGNVVVVASHSGQALAVKVN